MPEKVTYITYGKESFDIDEFYREKPIKPLPMKPSIGLWASRIDAEFGWKDWCESEEYGNLNCNFTFQLSDNAKIKEVHCEEDILDYIISDPLFSGLRLSRLSLFDTRKTLMSDGIDFEKLKSEGYDALELFISDNYYTLHLGVFNTWDCDSIVIWNPEIIIL